MIGINFSEFARWAFQIGSIWFSGRRGSGKSAGAYILACYLYDYGMVNHVVSNIEDTISEDVRVETVTDSAVILDEAWIYLEAWEDAKKYAGFIRKTKTILILPSVFPPHPKLRTLEVHRAQNLYGVGIPVWVYKWTVVINGERENGWFAIWKPDRAFSVYSTNYIPSGDFGIVSAINDAIRATVSRQGDGGGRAYVSENEGEEFMELLKKGRRRGGGTKRTAKDKAVGLGNEEKGETNSPKPGI